MSKSVVPRWVRLILSGFLGLLLCFGCVFIENISFVQNISRVQAQTSLIDQMQASQRYYQDGQFSASADLLEEIVESCAAAGERLSQAQALRFWALPLQALGQWEQAQSALEQSLTLLETLPADPQLRAQVLNAQGKGQLATGQTALALESWQLAETVYSAANNLEGILGSQLNQTTALQALGFYRQARTQLNQIEERLETYPASGLKVKGLLNLGNIMRLQGEIGRSQTLLEESLAIAQEIPNSPDLSQIYLSLANTHRVLHARQLSTEASKDTYLKTALSYYEQAASLAPSPLSRLQAQLNLLSLLVDAAPTEIISTKSPADLIAILADELPQLPASRPAIYAQINFAQSLMALSQDSSQLEPEAILNLAVQRARDLKDSRAYSYALGTLGTWHEQQQHWQQALALTQSALDRAQSLGAADITYQWQWQMGRLLRQTGRAAAAIAPYTAAVETLSQLRSDLVTLNPDIQFEFRASVEPVYRQLVDLLLRDAQPGSARLTQARDVIEALQLAELDNFFRDACASPAAVNIDNLDPQAAVLYPIVLEDRLEIIFKPPGTAPLQHYSQPNVSAAQVGQTVSKLLTQLRRRSSNPQVLKQTAQQLYTWLIQPFEMALETTLEREQSSVKTLTFVLDGPLRNVPMAALYDGNRYLVERYAIATPPSLNLLEPRPLPRQALHALLAGAEDAPSFRAANLSPLNNVPQELDGIQQTLPNSRRLENEIFLKDTLSEQINKTPFNVVHLATHGQFSANPDETFILDWRSRIPAKDIDDLLFLIDPQRAVEDPIELLILSACETAAGDDRAALGLAGLAIRAGARSTVATLWNINDASTADFMVRFYQQLQRPDLNRAEALRNTQIAFLQNAEGSDYSGTDYRRPYHWAAFILVGNWL